MPVTPATPAPVSLSARLSGRTAAWSLAAVGLATLAAYGALWLHPLWLGRFSPFAGSAQAIAPILGLDAEGIVRYVAAFTVPTALYPAALLLVSRAPARPALVTGALVTAAAPLLLLFTYPALAADVFDYLMSARILAHYDVNPYRTAALAFPDDPYYPPVGWKGLPSVYGPVWVWVSALPVALAGDRPVMGLVLIKLLAVGCHLGVAALVYQTARTVAPDRAVWSLVAYGWNPLAIVHFAVDGHNDALLLLFLMAALYLALRREWEFAFPCLALAALTKYVPVLLVPAFLVAARREPQRAAVGVALSLLLCAATFAPLWAGAETFDGVRDQASRMTSSPAALLSYYLPDSWLRPLAMAAFGAGYLGILLRVQGLLRQSYAALVLYYVTLTFWTKGWYFTWALAVGAVLGGLPFAAVALAGVGAFVANLFGGWGWMMDWWHWQGRWGIEMMEAWLTGSLYLPWAVTGLWWLLRARLRRAPER